MASRRKGGGGDKGDGEARTLMERGEEGDDDEDVGVKRGYGGDGNNIALLMLLYILQGIPLGLAGSIPMILQNRHVSYKDQATFSLAFWPFSIKLLWAPLVDSIYFERIGRRKSWLIPSQYLIGGFMLLLSSHIDTLLGESDSIIPPNVVVITSVFFALNFLAATQDIAVDGWALTILSRANVGWASTCNSVGQTVGYFTGFVVFLALESRDFCVNYLGQSDSLVNLSGFLYFWGIVFCLTTTGVWLFKSEGRQQQVGGSDEPDLGLVGTYKVLGSILMKPTMISLITVLLTCKIGFAAADSLTALKLTEYGVPKDRLALLSIPLTPVQVLLPLYISRYTSGPRPLTPFIYGYPLRLVFGLVLAGLVWWTPYFKADDGSFPLHYYGLIVLIYVFHQVFVNCMFVGVMAFYARISDTNVGGTYMTLLNTFTNLGGNWPSWVALRYVTELTWTTCVPPTILPEEPLNLPQTCYPNDNRKLCEDSGGVCDVGLDGYYVESLVLVVVGLLWARWGLPTIRRLQELPISAWAVTYRNNHTQ